MEGNTAIQLPGLMPVGYLPRVVILGGGFGGLAATKALRSAQVEVTLIDQKNHHLFQPLLYQVATAALNPSDIAVPIRSIWAMDAPGLKTLGDALAIRERILLAFESAEWEPDPVRQKAWLTFVVVGGGPTGVELAGAIAEIARHVLTQDFRWIKPGKARVVLVEAGPRILPGFSPNLARKATEALTHLGVEVCTGKPVTALDKSGATIGGERVEARTILWAAGVGGSPLARSLGVPLGPGGRVPVQPDLSIAGAPGLFVIGDLAFLEQDGRPLPALAPVAVQEGRHAAENILRSIKGLEGQSFTYRSRGTLATIGRAAAVAELARLEFSGFAAWLLWLLVHIMWLIGFRNRFLVLTEWAWTYLRYERGARLITGTPSRMPTE